MNNIYSNYGVIIDTDRYIKREVEKNIEDRVCDRNYYGSISIVGLQRIGKSSIAYNMFVKNKERYLEERTMIVSIKISDYESHELFFRDLIQYTYEELEINDFLTDIIERRYKRAVECTLKKDGASAFLSFYKAIKTANIKTIIIIDEFDHATKVFKDFIESFQILRDLSYQPEIKAALVLISRRHIEEIEIDTQGISTFSGILSRVYVKPYSESELKEYFNIFFNKNEITYDEILIKDFRTLSGNLPLLLDTLAYHYINERMTKNADEIFRNYIGEIYDNMNKTINLLNEQKLLKKLMQFVFGPVFDATKEDFYKLESYGIISEENNEIYVFSEAFQDLLSYKQDSIDFYPLWNKTEKGLREICRRVFSENYNNWENEIFNKYKDLYESQERKTYRPKNIYEYIVDALKVIRRMKRFDSYIENTKTTFIDGMSTGGLFQLMDEEWSLFKDIFNEPKNKWADLTKHVTYARNPYQHNNDDYLTDKFKTQTKMYLEIINEKIDAYFQK